VPIVVNKKKTVKKAVQIYIVFTWYYACPNTKAAKQQIIT